MLALIYRRSNAPKMQHDSKEVNLATSYSSVIKQKHTKHNKIYQTQI